MSLSSPPPKQPRSQCGFTLIELMIATAVIGILSTLAVPSFENHIHRARRSDVLVSMVQIQAAQERFRSNRASYGSLDEIGVVSVSTAGHYQLAASAINAQGYEVLLTATGAQARDKTCRHMKFSSTGGNMVYASGSDAELTNTSAVNHQCWML
jgi:type IV pilus assembly protein PilE